jgi:cysteine desulfuration protein SufE
VIKDRIAEVITEFNSHTSWEGKYKELINFGKNMPAYTEEFRTEDNKVRGCQSQVWLHSSFEDGKIIFEADSDASIVKGVIAILVKVYSGSTPQEILSTPPTFLEDIELKQHLSMSRSNGLASMLKQINIYAFAYKTKVEMGLL